MPPRKTQQVLESWYSDDGGSAAHSGDDGAPGLAAVPAVRQRYCDPPSCTTSHSSKRHREASIAGAKLGMRFKT
jgi:hypothetical protein